LVGAAVKSAAARKMKKDTRSREPSRFKKSR
jgi:hypothetical protein